MKSTRAKARVEFEWTCPSCQHQDSVWSESAYLPQKDEIIKCSFCHEEYLVDVPEITINYGESNDAI